MKSIVVSGSEGWFYHHITKYNAIQLNHHYLVYMIMDIALPKQA